jgi:hypothetical protein
MSSARNWAGKVKWHVDNKGVIENFWPMPNCVANDCGARWGTELSLGILVACRMLLQVCGMSNIREGMSREGEKIRVSGQINEEKGNVEADHVCGRARKMALGWG